MLRLRVSLPLLGGDRRGVAQWRSSGVAFVDKLLDFLNSDVGKAVHYLVLDFSPWAAATSFTMVLLGRHFVCDVLAGAYLGVIEALIVFQFLNYSILASIILR